MLKQIENTVCKVILAIYRFKDLGTWPSTKATDCGCFRHRDPWTFHTPSVSTVLHTIIACALNMGNTNTIPQINCIIQDSSQNYLCSEPLFIKPQAHRPILY